MPRVRETIQIDELRDTRVANDVLDQIGANEARATGD
jgi:hypothetical protein